MPPVQTVTCPHCDKVLKRGEMPDFMSVAAGASSGVTVYVLLCPKCNKPWGSYAAPSNWN